MKKKTQKIKINEHFSISRDPWCWILYEKLPKAKTPKQTYHANLEQIAYTVINREAGKCETLTEILKYLKEAESIVTQQLKTVYNNNLE